MLKFYQNEIKDDAMLKENPQKSGAYSLDPFTVNTKGGILPTSSIISGLRKTGMSIKSLIAGEPINVGETTMIGDGTNYDIVDTAQTNDGTFAIGYTGQTKVEQSFQVATSFSAKYCLVELRKTGSPTDNLVWNLRQAQDGGSIATGSIAGADLTTSLVVYTLDFGDYIRFSGATAYRIEFSRSGALDAVNYYNIGTQLTGTYANGTLSYFGVGWTADARDADMIIRKVLITDQVFLASSLTATFSNLYIGIAPKNFVYGARIEPVFDGYVSGMSGLTQGSTYYLQDNQGAIGTSAGTVSRVIGKAYSSTEFYCISTT